MIFSWKIPAGTVLVLGVGGVSLFGANEFSRKTVSDSLGKVKMVSFKEGKSQEAWQKLLEKLKDSSKEAKSPEFASLKNDMKSSSDSSKLKEFCKDSEKKSYSSLFYKGDEKFLDDVKLFCSIKIEEVADSSSLFDVSKKELIKTRYLHLLENRITTLMSYSSDVYDLGELDESLNFLKNIGKNNEKTHGDLLNWCEENYNSSYIDEDQPLFKQVLEYCKNSW